MNRQIITMRQWPRTDEIPPATRAMLDALAEPPAAPEPQSFLRSLVLPLLVFGGLFLLGTGPYFYRSIFH